MLSYLNNLIQRYSSLLWNCLLITLSLSLFRDPTSAILCIEMRTGSRLWSWKIGPVQNIKNITFLFSVKYRQYNINSVPNWLFNCVFASMVNLVNRIKTLIIEKIFNTYIDKCVKSAETFQSYHSQLAIYVIKVLAELPYL